MASTVQHYSEETLNELRRMFKEYDMNDDGNLNSEELEQCLQLVGFYPTADDIEFLKKHFDTNGDGLLQIEELLQNIHIINEHSLHKDDFMEAFKKFDANNDGYIRLAEMLKILTINSFMSVEEARVLLNQLVKDHDQNHDGKFSYAEFVEALVTSGKTSENLIAHGEANQ